MPSAVKKIYMAKFLLLHKHTLQRKHITSQRDDSQTDTLAHVFTYIENSMFA